MAVALKLGGVGAFIMLTGACYWVEALSNQPSELNPVPSHPSRSTRALQVGSFGSSYNLCYVNGRDVYFYREKAQMKREKNRKSRPSKRFWYQCQGGLKDKTTFFSPFLWLKENTSKSLVHSWHSKLARAIPEATCHKVFNNGQWKWGSEMQYPCEQAPGCLGTLLPLPWPN